MTVFLGLLGTFAISVLALIGAGMLYIWWQDKKLTKAIANRPDTYIKIEPRVKGDKPTPLSPPNPNLPFYKE